jgi:hypothetical protein
MSGRVVAIHQPNYLPWIGYFHKIYRSDVFVYLNGVEYTSGSWMNRNKVKTPDGWTWLTVPIRDSGGPIHDVRIATQEDWQAEHWKTLQHNYGGANHFESWRPFLKRTYDREWAYLYPLNRHLVEGICDRLDLDCEFVESSTFCVDGEASERLAALCEVVDADIYLCGMGSDEYMDETPFDIRGISVEYQNFEYPTYEQRFDGFIPQLSVLDLVLNEGIEDAREVLTSL